MSFEAGPVNPQPHSITTFTSPNDPNAVLPPDAQRKFTSLTQRASDLHAQMIKFETINEVATARTASENRITHLLRRRSEGGMGMSENDPSVFDERRKLERATRNGNGWRNCAMLKRPLEYLQAVGGQRNRLDHEGRHSRWLRA